MMSAQGDSKLRCFYHNESRRVCYTPRLSSIPHVPSSSPAPPSRRDPHDTYRTALLPPLEGPSTRPSGSTPAFATPRSRHFSFMGFAPRPAYDLSPRHARHHEMPERESTLYHERFSHPARRHRPHAAFWGRLARPTSAAFAFELCPPLWLPALISTVYRSTLFPLLIPAIVLVFSPTYLPFSPSPLPRSP
ncbi:hypothetical protein K523DRAFT_380609 [Schizophyllum commune Tattone D]|nr:hypothetical protein K525DRAFT_286000 [Schizophyllum commune Loenen D]KAI5830776.1 hypothetical protein K523DRAFT_380609 [Schizophyllum commune Tattone D]